MALGISLLDSRQHERNAFACGVTTLDDYLRQRAAQHQREGIATVHVLVDSAQPSRILGYCALSAAQLYLHELHEADRKRLPAWPVPAMRMGRLAIERLWQNLARSRGKPCTFSAPDNGRARVDSRCQRRSSRRVLPKLRLSPDDK